MANTDYDHQETSLLSSLNQLEISYHVPKHINKVKLDFLGGNDGDTHSGR